MINNNNYQLMKLTIKDIFNSFIEIIKNMDNINFINKEYKELKNKASYNLYYDIKYLSKQGLTYNHLTNLINEMIENNLLMVDNYIKELLIKMDYYYELRDYFILNNQMIEYKLAKELIPFYHNYYSNNPFIKNKIETMELIFREYNLLIEIIKECIQAHKTQLIANQEEGNNE